MLSLGRLVPLSACVLATLLATATQAFSQGNASPVTSVVASAKLVDGVIVIHVKNNYVYPLEAWSVKVWYDTPARPNRGTQIDSETYKMHSATGQGPRRIGPIAPGETRVMHFRSEGASAVRSVQMRGALFRDLRYEGAEDVQAKFFSDRELEAQEIEEWLPVLDAAMKAPGPGRLKIVETAQERLARADPNSRQPTGLGRRFQRLNEFPPDRLQQFPEYLKAVLDELVRTRQLALRHRNGGGL